MVDHVVVGIVSDSRYLIRAPVCIAHSPIGIELDEFQMRLDYRPAGIVKNIVPPRLRVVRGAGIGVVVAGGEHKTVARIDKGGLARCLPHFCRAAVIIEDVHLLQTGGSPEIDARGVTVHRRRHGVTLSVAGKVLPPGRPGVVYGADLQPCSASPVGASRVRGQRVASALAQCWHLYAPVVGAWNSSEA